MSSSPAYQALLAKVGSESFNATDRDLEMKKMAALMIGDTFTLLNLFHKEVVALRKENKELLQKAEKAAEVADDLEEKLWDVNDKYEDVSEKLEEAVQMAAHSQKFIKEQKEKIEELLEQFASVYDAKQDLEASLLSPFAHSEPQYVE